jgi:hypothetical protein
MQKFSYDIGFEEKRHFLPKIAEISHLNIGPRLFRAPPSSSSTVLLNTAKRTFSSTSASGEVLKKDINMYINVYKFDFFLL